MILQRRLDALNQDKSDWIEHSHNIVDQSNNTVHSTIEIKPNGAKLHQNHLRVSWHLWNPVKRDRKYEEIRKRRRYG